MPTLSQDNLNNLWSGLVNGHYFLNLGDFFLKDSFYTLFHCHSSTGATLTGTLQAYFNGVIVIYANQLNIAAMTLQSRPKVLNRAFDLLLKCLVSISFFNFAATTLFTHSKSPKNFQSPVIIAAI
jgi:hypothetical protein